MTRVTTARVRRAAAAALPLLASALLALSALPAVDYCVDGATGSDTAGGLCSDQAWETLAPTVSYPFQSGDRVLIAEGRYLYPLTGWYMLPGVSWIGAGADRTTVVANRLAEVPFVRFSTGSAGSGPPADLRLQAFGPDTVLAAMTLQNDGTATIGIDVRVTAADSSPTLRDLVITGFPTGIALHPSSDERASASTHALLTRNVIRGAEDTGVVFYADVFYTRQVTEASTMTNSTVDSAAVGAGIRTFISYSSNYDPADAVSAPVLTNNTVRGETGSGALLISYLDDGYGRWAATEHAGTLSPVLRNSIFTGSERYGIEEYSTWTDPLEVSGNALGGNALGDYLDEGSTPVGAGAIGTGNIPDPPLLVDPGSGDLHQATGSPTVDRLDPATAPADDMDGQARPQSALADIGADEYMACTAIADPSATRHGAPCTGEPTELDASASTVDPVCAEGLLYEWWDGASLLATGVTHTWDPPAVTEVTLRVRCADPALSACRDEAALQVQPSSPAVLAHAGPDLILAVGEAASLGAAPSASGGTPPYDYAWAPDPPELDTGTNPANPVYSPAAPGETTFTLTVLDAADCGAQDAVTVTVVPALTAEAGPDRTITTAQQTVLGGAPAATGGQPPYAWAWSPGSGLDATDVERPTFTPPAAGLYTFRLTVTDAAQRTASDQVRITVEGVTGQPPGEAGEVRVRNLCPADGWVRVSFRAAERADFHRLYAAALGSFPDHANLPAPEGCDSATGDPDVAGEFRATSACGPGSLYFLVVGVNGDGEGPYGSSRPPGIPACP